MKILISNDDGIFAPGILALANAMSELSDDITVVAPDVEQSAAGHSITVRRPLRYIPTRLKHLKAGKAYRVDGTPADCIMLGVHNEGRPDIVVSGINLGANLGFDVTHSGTVAAAFEGCTMGIPSIAFSMRLEGKQDLDFSQAAAYAKTLVAQVAQSGLPKRTLLNVNFPDGAEMRYKGIKTALQSEHNWTDTILERQDPQGRPYYWMAGNPGSDDSPNSDYAVVREGYVSVTPLHLDLTNRAFLGDLARIIGTEDDTE